MCEAAVAVANFPGASMRGEPGYCRVARASELVGGMQSFLWLSSKDFSPQESKLIFVKFSQ